ncbi:MAG: 4-(cytidine 5'-diphospho)-2-C-methyl-D-erythritol kinase [Gammaproteobacteria bacterium]|nr:4-(cytidine 5'-diphospho)-2-C-methyl-D-erythritol kinase [Gammaproteobacteria bacterium]
MQTWPAPAKLNLFLHIIGQREDGYHLLQSAIQFIDLCDELTFTPRKDTNIVCKNSNTNISQQDDLCLRAAQLLQNQKVAKYEGQRGVDIQVKKKIPLGAGLGGGSSDAATTLLALNQIWECGLQLQDLEKMAVRLGADVPIFVRGHASWVEGVGEQLSSITIEEPWYVVVFPNVHLNTQQMFADPDLTRDCVPIKIRDFLQGKLADFEETKNVFESIARRQPAVERAFQCIEEYVPARLTGSGSALFAVCESKQQAEGVAANCTKEFSVYVTKGLNCSPVISLSEYNHAHL